MNDGFPYMDIVFFAVVAIFLVLRLRSVLGRRTGEESPPRWTGSDRPGQAPEQSAADNVIDLPRARKSVEAPIFTGPGAEGLKAIAKIDSGFTQDGFLAGARGAFEVIVSAYAAGDKKALRPLLADSVYHPFVQAIDARQTDGEYLESELIGFKTVTVVGASLQGSVATVQVRFHSQQVNVMRNKTGQVIDGDPNHITDIIDEWTFSRDLKNRDPNWQLIATRTPAADEV